MVYFCRRYGCINPKVALWLMANEGGWLVAVIGLEILHRSIADDLLVDGETILAVVLFRLL